MKDFAVRRGLYWIVQWMRLFSATLGVITFGYLDFGLKCEGWYLDMMTRWNLRQRSSS